MAQRSPLIYFNCQFSSCLISYIYNSIKAGLKQMWNDIKLPNVSLRLCPFTLCWLVNSNCTLLITPFQYRSGLGGQEFWIKYLYMHFKPNYCRHMAKDIIYMLGLLKGMRQESSWLQWPIPMYLMEHEHLSNMDLAMLLACSASTTRNVIGN